MSLKFGDLNIGSMYFGERKIAEGWLGDVKVYGGSSPVLPANTIRLEYTDGVTPTFTYGTATQVSSSPNVWDLTYNNTLWNNLLAYHSDLLQVIAANTTGVTSMVAMFNNCTSLTSVPLFDTSSVTSMVDMFYKCTNLASVPLFDTSSVTTIYRMFWNCTSLTSVPLFDTSNVTNMVEMFINCRYVESGALALYQQASMQTTPPANHTNTFYKCGANTVTGRAELAQIPTDWGGTAH